MHLCMTHRYEDMHDCKPIKESVEYEKIKQSNRLFNWGIKIKKSGGGGNGNQAEGDELSFWQKLARLCVCCMPTNKDKKNKNKKKKKYKLYLIIYVLSKIIVFIKN